MKLQFWALFFLPVLLNAQDTLIFKNGDKKTATLKEISVNEVKYTKFGQTESPVYIVYKDELAFIKYANGKTDSLSSQNIVKGTDFPSSSAKLRMGGNYLYYNSRAIDDFELKRLIDEYPYPQTKESMLKKFKVMEKYRRKQGLAKGLIPFGCALPVIGLVSAFVLSFSQPFGSDLPDVVFASGFGLGVVTVANGIVFSIRNKKKKNEEKFDISVLYNGMR